MHPRPYEDLSRIQTGQILANDAHLHLVRFSCLAVIVLLCLGIWAFLPNLIIEHRRIEHWKLIGLWAGDAVAFLWFIRFAFLHTLLRKPLASASAATNRRNFTGFALVITLALFVDLGFTLSLMHGEREAYRRGQVTEAQVLNMHIHKRAKADWYAIDGGFQDGGGRQHTAHVRIEAENGILPSALPIYVARALSAQPQALRTFPIRYDPEFPARAWVDGLGWDDGNRLYWFSLLTLFFQAITTALFLLQVYQRSARGNRPWWTDTYNAIPLVAQSFWMFALGTIDRLLG